MTDDNPYDFDDRLAGAVQAHTERISDLERELSEAYARHMLALIADFQAQLMGMARDVDLLKETVSVQQRRIEELERRAGVEPQPVVVKTKPEDDVPF